jgi:glucose/arabinose dehydrogenase
MSRWRTLVVVGVLALSGTVALPAPVQAVEPPVETVVSGAGGVVWSVAFAPDGRFFYSVRQTGEVFAGRRGSAPQRLIDLPSCGDCGEGGLMGLATSPTFASDGYLYAMYTYRSGSTIGNRVVRLSVGSDRATVSGTVLDGIPGGTTHDGGRLRFGPDGFLYATVGDARLSPNPAQNTGNLAGKILRLSPTGGAAPGNPFGNAVWSYGHRNSQGLDWRSDGTLYALEHGPGCRDELNRIVRGGNYGWTGDERCPPAFPPGAIAPVKVYTETSTVAPSGASFYDSSGIPEWTGSLLFATLKDSTLYRVRLSADGRSVVGEEQLYRGRFGRLRDVQEGPDGGVWLTTDDGRVLRIAPTSSTPSPAPSPAPTSGCSAAVAQVLDQTITATGSARVQIRGTRGSTVDLHAYTRPSTDFRVVRTVTIPAGTGPDPVVSLRPPGNTRLYAQQRGCPAGPQSIINVRTALSLSAERDGVRAYTFSGDSLPARPGGLIVSLYRIASDGRQVLTAQSRADAQNGEWRIVRRFTGTGRFGFLVRTGQDLQNAPGASNVRSTVIH